MDGPAPIVDATWLREHHDDVVICDTRWSLADGPRRDAYTTGHVPGAVFVDLDRHLAGPPSPEQGRHPLPHPDDFARSMGALGIGDGDTVVGYDDPGGAIAARLVWMLRALGENAALLDGGLAGWEGPLEEGAVVRPPASFTARPWPLERVASIEDVEGVAVGELPSTLVDARDAERYRGDAEPVDPRAGHIPGARNAPWTGNLDPDTGRFLPAADLRERYSRLGIEPAHDVIVSCGSGVTACHDLLAIEAAGLGPGRLYAGSWSQWSSDPSRPVATGDETGGV